MNVGHRQHEPSRTRRARPLRPVVQGLESRTLLAIDLVNVIGTVDASGNPIPPGPYGIIEAGQTPGLGAGWSVAEVGDVNADGFDDFLVGAPTVNVNGGLFPTVGTGANARAFLVFGSRQVNAGNFDFRNLFPSTLVAPPSPPPGNQRGGDLGGLGNGTQANPVTGENGFPFDGLTFSTSQNPASALGASVAGVGDVNGDGIPDFMIGAPGALDANGANTNTGRAYLIYGDTDLGTRTSKQVDLDNTSGANADLDILTFTNLAQNNAFTGDSVAGIGDFIADGFADVAIGAPGASFGLANQGAVYAISGALLRPARTATIPLDQIGQAASGLGGYILLGAVSGDSTGSAIAGAGNTAGRTTSANQPIGDLLIGAPDVTPTGVFNGTGSAYLFYGDSTQNLDAFVITAAGSSVIPLADVGTNIPGAVFNGDVGGGDEAGFAVSTAGDFNNDGLSDFLIGSPGWDSPTAGANAGRATMIFGSTTLINGSLSLSDLPAAVSFVEFDGATVNATAGFSLTATLDMNGDLINEIAIGSPGINGGSGQVYIIPGNPDLLDVQQLSAAEASPLFGLIISASLFANQPNLPNLLGTSVSGNLSVNSSGVTFDNDAVGDLIVGAAGFSLTNARGGAGAAYGLEGVFLPVPTPVSTAIVAQIGIDQPFPPFVISATQPPEMLIFVLSDATLTPPFQPLDDIDPTTVVVNGVAFPDATIGPTTPADLNNDGIPDAVITISPRSSLGLTTNTRTISFSARTLDTSPNANRRVTGQATVTVSGGGGGGGGLPSNRNVLLGLGNPNAAVPPFGERLIPNPAVLTKLHWRRLGRPAQFKQFLPQAFFAGRFKRFYHGPADLDVIPKSRKKYTGYRTTTLGTHVFARSKFPSSGVVDARRTHGIIKGPRRG